MKEFILYSRDTLRYMILHTLYLPTQPIMHVLKLPSLKMPRYLLPPSRLRLFRQRPTARGVWKVLSAAGDEGRGVEHLLHLRQVLPDQVATHGVGVFRHLRAVRAVEVPDLQADTDRQQCHVSWLY